MFEENLTFNTRAEEGRISSVNYFEGRKQTPSFDIITDIITGMLIA